jgi:TonB-linked SusC/RagA family outer membrane protein
LLYDEGQRSADLKPTKPNFMMKPILLFMLLFSISYAASAQNRQLTGNVTDKSSGEALVGVGILLKGTALTTTTDANGNFKLSIPDKKEVIIVFRYVGYKQLELSVKDQKSINVALVSESVQLNEVVAIGYGTVNRRDLTGSVSSVSAAQLKDIPVNSAAQALAGRLAGVDITASEGAPDSEVKILIRGGNSITQDNSPLYIVDGIQVEDGLSSLSPQDIESVDILKDASSTAIYGSRGLSQYDRITLGELVEDFEDSFGPVSEIGKYKDKPFIDWQDRAMGRNALMYTHNLSASGGTKASRYSLNLSDNRQDGTVLNSGLERKMLSFKFDHTANNKLKLGFNLRYLEKAVSASGTADEASSGYAMLRHTIKYAPYNQSNLPDDFIDEEYYAETNPGNGLGILNPVILANSMYRMDYTKITNMSGYFEYTFTPNITFKSALGLSYTNRDRNSFDDFITPRARVTGGMPMVGLLTNKQFSLNNSNVLSFSNLKLKKDHTFNFLLGQEIYNVKADNIGNQLNQFPKGIEAEQALNQLSLGKSLPLYPNSGSFESKLLSFFSRAGYSYKGKYLLTATLRADGSSKFSQENRWGYFPSAAVAWRVSGENFMKKITVISDLKIRVSSGVTGNIRLPDYRYQTTYDSKDVKYILNNEIQPGLAVSYLATPDLKWETTTSRNLGLDLNLFKGKLVLNFDLYRNTTNDLLVNAPIPNTSGYISQLLNIASTSNRGAEIQLSANIISTKSFTWRSNFNMGFNKNRIEKLAGNQTVDYYSSGVGIANLPSDYIVKEGEAVGAMYGHVTDGFYKVEDFDWVGTVYKLKSGIADVTSTLGAPKPGLMKLKDLNGDGIVNESDKTILGYANPKFSGGLNQQFSYKGFDLSVFLNFKYGNKVFNANKVEFSNAYSKNTNMLAVMKNRFRWIDENFNYVTDPVQLAEINKDANIWMPLKTAGAFNITSWAVEDASFLRVNNITLGYTVNSKFLRKLKIDNLRFYGTVNNIAVFTNYSGFDPEVDSRRGTPLTPGVDYSAYPRSRTYLLGVNISL